MECLKPNKGYYLPDGTHKFGKSPTGHETEHDIGCGYCEPCRTAKVKLRGFKSFSNTLFTEEAMFLNLTYGTFVPITPNGLYTLDKRIMPLFNKRFRKYLADNAEETGNPQIGNIYCGEYGDKDERPHYHQITFGYSFKDQYYWRTSKKGNPLYRSPTLETLWPFGHAEIGSVTAASCTYVAGYLYKKQYGQNKIKHYGDREPEYVVTPKKNYVTGRAYITENIDSIASLGYIQTIEGHAIGIDTHTMNWIKSKFPEKYMELKLKKESYDMKKMSKEEKFAWELTQAKHKELRNARR